MTSACIFCAIIEKQKHTRIVEENEHVIVFPDRMPRAPIHYLIVSKKHIKNFNDLKQEDYETVLAMVCMAQHLAKKHVATADHGFNLIVNNGASAGQVVFHMHWHFLAGRGLSANDLPV